MPIERARPPAAYALRAPCRYCGETSGYLETRNGQDCVFCARCARLAYNAPKSETGRAPRPVMDGREPISARRRVHLLERANGRCELCGATGNLHIGHLVSLKDGPALGLSEAELNGDENLAVLCDACNLGLGSESVPARLMAALVKRRHGSTP